MSKAPNLRPCPFCGESAGIWNTGEYEPYRRQPSCTSCGCEIDDFHDDDTAAKAWNRRPIEDALLAVCEEMLALIRDGTCKDGSVSGVIIRAQAAIDGAKGGGA